MSVKSESIQVPTAERKAHMRVKPSDIVELHWPNGDGVELVQVLLVDATHAMVERIDFHSDEDARTRARLEWLRPYKNP